MGLNATKMNSDRLSWAHDPLSALSYTARKGSGAFFEQHLRKSYLHLASLTTTKEDTTLCYLYGRMLLIVLNYALCPQIRAHLWRQRQRERSLLKLVRHCQAFAARWRQAIFQS